jgi:hypothetical protein
VLRIESPVRCVRLGGAIGGMVGATCAKGQNVDARGRMFSDRWMIGSCGGVGAAAGRLIYRSDFSGFGRFNGASSFGS